MGMLVKLFPTLSYPSHDTVGQEAKIRLLAAPPGGVTLHLPFKKSTMANHHLPFPNPFVAFSWLHASFNRPKQGQCSEERLLPCR